MSDLYQARQTFDAVDTPSEIGRLDGRLEELETAIEDALANVECRSVGVEDLAEEEAPALGSAPEEPEPLVTGKGLGGATVSAVIWTAVIAAAAVAFAGLTVYTAAYHGKDTFASWSDYFALFSAALASGAASSVFAFLAYWEPDEEAEKA